MAGRKYPPQKTDLTKVTALTLKLSKLAAQIVSATQVIVESGDKSPGIYSFSTAERALKYLKGYQIGLQQTIQDLELGEEPAPEAKEKAKKAGQNALNAEAKANKRSRKSSN